MTEPVVLIVGAGPTGLVLALCLARHGVKFRIIDARAGPGEASRALVVHARTLEFYAQIGLAETIIAAGAKLDTVRWRLQGRDTASVDLGDIGDGLSRFPFLLALPQDDHERLLVDRLAALGVAVEWNTRLLGLKDNGDAVTVNLEANAPETARFAYVCGCDGASSQVRHSIGVEFPGGTYHQLFYVAEVALANPARAEFCINLTSDAFALTMPVRSRGMQRLVGILPPGIARESADFEAIRVEAEAMLQTSIISVNWFSAYQVHHRVASHFRIGRCFLAGDAGHVHSPAGGQGMNTGIGDAVNLAWKLAAVVAGKAPPALLDSYESERIAFARLLVATTDRAFVTLMRGGVPGWLVRMVIGPFLLPLLVRLKAARRGLFGAVSQIRIAYPESALSAGSAGSVAGGDRLPWVSGDGQDNFRPLESLRWQLHVYGTTSPQLAAAAAGLGLDNHGFAWGDAALRAGLARDAAYLVRPDGHVALALETQDGDAVIAYLQRHEIVVE